MRANKVMGRVFSIWVAEREGGASQAGITREGAGERASDRSITGTDVRTHGRVCVG